MAFTTFSLSSKLNKQNIKKGNTLTLIFLTKQPPSLNCIQHTPLSYNRPPLPQLLYLSSSPGLVSSPFTSPFIFSSAFFYYFSFSLSTVLNSSSVPLFLSVFSIQTVCFNFETDSVQCVCVGWGGGAVQDKKCVCVCVG